MASIHLERDGDLSIFRIQDTSRTIRVSKLRNNGEVALYMMQTLQDEEIAFYIYAIVRKILGVAVTYDANSTG